MFALAILASSRASRVPKIGQQPLRRRPIGPYPFPLKYSSHHQEANMINPYTKQMRDIIAKEIAKWKDQIHFDRNAEDSVDDDNIPAFVIPVVKFITPIVLDQIASRVFHNGVANAEESTIDDDNIPAFVIPAIQIVGGIVVDEILKRVLPNNVNAEMALDDDNFPWDKVGEVVWKCALQEAVKWAMGQVLPHNSVSNSFKPYVPRRPVWKAY